MKVSKQTNISEERIRHMHGVAELMYKYHDTFGCKVLNKAECYLLGLNHDIGYLFGKEKHESSGANIFTKFCESKKQTIFSKCICYHGVSPQKYLECTSVKNIPNELILLWWADLHVESSGEFAGEIVDFQKRLNGIKNRLGENSEAYQNSQETVKWLIQFIAKKRLQTILM